MIGHSCKLDGSLKHGTADAPAAKGSALEGTKLINFARCRRDDPAQRCKVRAVIGSLQNWQDGYR
ncbi:MAG: hypothetical protein ABDH66_06205, partial [Bacteroidia bacterium]